jgi:pimeloyl-ACP methyl ester carboxylesterase
MALPIYERAFAAVGIAVLSFDYRHLGASPGEPRQLISVRRQVQDLTSAVAYLRTHAQIDSCRVGLWGTSFGAAHVLTVAAADRRIAAAVVQCPIIDGLDAARRLGARHAISLTAPIVHDLMCRVTRRTRPTIGIVGRAGDRALVTVPGAADGWESLMPDGYRFENRVTPSVALEMARYRPARATANIACPLLVVVSQRESLMDPAIAERAAEAAPRGEDHFVDADHFGVYHPPLLEGLLEKETAFLHTHLVAS